MTTYRRHRNRRTGWSCHTARVTGFLDGIPPRAFAHRGWHVGDLAGRENTLAAFRRAVEAGYRYLETDVHLTADGELVVFHDRQLDRVTDRTGLIANLTWAQVRQARVGDTEPIPLLSELLAEFPDVRLNIDAKSDTAVGPLADLIRTSGAIDRVCLGSFYDHRLVQLRRLLGAEATTSMGSREIFRLVRATRLRRRFHTPARAAQVPVSFRGVRIVTPRFLSTAKAAGLEVHVWTIDEPSEMRRLLDMGVDGVMTDRPDLLRQVLTERGDWR